MQRINSFLRNNAELALISSKAQNLTACQKIWDAVAPETLKPFTQAGDINHKRLTVYANNGAVAAKVKLLLPSLLTNLQKHGLEVTSIRVLVQVQSSPSKPPKPVRKLSAFAATELEKLAGQLEDDSPLAASLKRLSAHSSEK
ncbi:MAG: DUF721 domain-containing protein [Betaproteobacteria bacterium HGW-Betaproteobacteria-8]|nr:MAG: DUF721 domain-containing protein [Betaproteobacteria bacterium HGW-Betaproteobacteria-8]